MCFNPDFPSQTYSASPGFSTVKEGRCSGPWCEHKNYFERCFYVTVIIVLTTAAGKGVFLFHGPIVHCAEFLSALSQCGEVLPTSLTSPEDHFLQMCESTPTALFLLLSGFLSLNDRWLSSEPSNVFTLVHLLVNVLFQVE